MKFLAGMWVGLMIMGILETCIPGIGLHEAVFVHCGASQDDV